MIKGLKLRKNSRPVSRRIKAGIAIGVLLLLIAGGIAGWYFFAYEPAQQRDEIKRREAQQLANDISTVDKFYLSNLSGGSISKFTTLAAEISKSQRILSDFNYINEVYTCDAKNCSFSYQLKKVACLRSHRKYFLITFILPVFQILPLISQELNQDWMTTRYCLHTRIKRIFIRPLAVMC